MEGPKCVILCAALNEDVLSDIVPKLMTCGIDTEQVDTYMSCVQWLVKHDCQLVVVHLPQLDNAEIEFIQVIRQMKDMPILALIESECEGDKKKMFEAGVDDYFLQPIIASDFVFRARSLIRRYQSYCQCIDSEEKRKVIALPQLIMTRTSDMAQISCIGGLVPVGTNGRPA